MISNPIKQIRDQWLTAMSRQNKTELQSIRQARGRVSRCLKLLSQEKRNREQQQLHFFIYLLKTAPLSRCSKNINNNDRMRQTEKKQLVPYHLFSYFPLLKVVYKLNDEEVFATLLQMNQDQLSDREDWKLCKRQILLLLFLHILLSYLWNVVKAR